MTFTNAYRATFRNADAEIDFLLRDEVFGITIVGVDDDDRSIWYFRLWSWIEANELIHNISRITDDVYESEWFHTNPSQRGIAR